MFSLGWGVMIAVLVASFDSQLKWCASVQKAFLERNIKTFILVPNDRRHFVSKEQIRASSASFVSFAGWKECVARSAQADIVGCSLIGPNLRNFFIEVVAASAGSERRPVMLGGWVGLVLERKIAGYLDRFFLDVLAVNCKKDLEDFVSCSGSLGLPTENLILSGLPYLPARLKPTTGDAIKTVLYADQPTVPDKYGHRLYLYSRLIDYARKFPDRRILLKPRHRLDEDTIHRMQHHPEVMLHGHKWPLNFSIDYRPMSDLIPQIDLLLTMSSTASLEACAAGCRVAYIADLGVNERFGNQLFLNSGLLRTFSELEVDQIGTINDYWLSEYSCSTGISASSLIVDRCLHLLKSGERPSLRAMDTSMFRSLGESAKWVGVKDPRHSVSDRILGTFAELPFGRSLKQRVKQMNGKRSASLA